MDQLLTSVSLPGARQRVDIRISDGTIAEIGTSLSSHSANQTDCCGLTAFPGFADVHVHFRDPGFCYKETVATGSRAAARGGYTAVCTMPNLDPVPDSLPHLKVQLARIADGAAVRVIPVGAITCGEQGKQLADMAAMAPYVVGFSDDGRGVADEGMMREAMLLAGSLGKPIIAHCEDNALRADGVIHQGAYAAAHGLPGIPSACEFRQIERDLRLAEETGCAYHICHMSARESVALLRAAKRAGLDVTGETAPHYLLLDETDLRDDGRFKMNPPLREPADREALVEAVCDGTIDMIATDHAPHSAAEKAGGLRTSIMGIVGLETAFPLLWTELVCKGVLTPERLTGLLCVRPRRRFGVGGSLRVGEPADLSLWDLEERYVIDPADFVSMGKSTPFAGKEVCGKCKMTMVGGKTVWQE